MKRKVYLIFYVLFLCFLLSCCISTNVFNKDLSLEQSAKLLIDISIDIKTYNSIPVKLGKPVFLGYTGFSIPAGKTEFTFDINWRLKAKNISFTYNFEAGKEYRLYGSFIDKEGNIKSSNVGETYTAVVLIQGTNTKEPLLVIRDFKRNNERLILN
jgi:hypothetical protein